MDAYLHLVLGFSQILRRHCRGGISVRNRSMRNCGLPCVSQFYFVHRAHKEFTAYTVCVPHVRLRTSSKKRWKRRLKKFRRQYREREVEFDEITRSIASYKGHLRHGHTYRLQQKVFHDFVLIKEKREKGEKM